MVACISERGSTHAFVRLDRITDSMCKGGEKEEETEDEDMGGVETAVWRYNPSI